MIVLIKIGLIADPHAKSHDKACTGDAIKVKDVNRKLSELRVV